MTNPTRFIPPIFKIHNLEPMPAPVPIPMPAPTEALKKQTSAIPASQVPVINSASAIGAVGILADVITSSTSALPMSASGSMHASPSAPTVSITEVQIQQPQPPQHQHQQPQHPLQPHLQAQSNTDKALICPISHGEKTIEHHESILSSKEENANRPSDSSATSSAHPSSAANLSAPLSVPPKKRSWLGINNIASALIYLAVGVSSLSIVHTAFWIIGAYALTSHQWKRYLSNRPLENNLLIAILPLIIAASLYFTPLIGTAISMTYLFGNQVKEYLKKSLIAASIINAVSQHLQDGNNFLYKKMLALFPEAPVSKLIDIANIAVTCIVAAYTAELSSLVLMPSLFVSAGLALGVAQQKPTHQQNIIDRNLAIIMLTLGCYSIVWACYIAIANSLYTAIVSDNWSQIISHSLKTFADEYLPDPICQAISLCVEYTKTGYSKVFGRKKDSNNKEVLATNQEGVRVIDVEPVIVPMLAPELSPSAPSLQPQQLQSGAHPQPKLQSPSLNSQEAKQPPAIATS
jgi:hypothetical protein